MDIFSDCRRCLVFMLEVEQSEKKLHNSYAILFFVFKRVLTCDIEFAILFIKLH